MKNEKIAFLFSVILILSACATPYQSKGFSGGFSETQLSENVFKVNFRGNGYTSSERASDFAMLRSAELTLENGYKYFYLSDNQNSVENSSYTTPVRVHTTGYSNAHGTLNTYGNYGTYSGSTYGNATTTVTGGQTYNIRKPKSMNTIVMFHKKPKQGVVLEAEFLERTLREKYKLVKEKPVQEDTEDSPAQ